MTSFLHWRKMTWAFVLWSAYLVTWMALTRSGPVIVVLWWLAGVGLLQLIIMHWGHIEPSGRHGPFEPCFGPRPNTARLPATDNELERTPTAGQHRSSSSSEASVQDWETEGGAIAEPPRASPTAQAA